MLCAGNSKAVPAVKAPVKGSVSAKQTPSPASPRDEDTQRDSRALAVRHSHH